MVFCFQSGGVEWWIDGWMEVCDDGEGIVFFLFLFFFFVHQVNGISWGCGNDRERERERKREREARASREPPCILLSSVIYLFLSISIVSTTDDDQHIYNLNYRVTLQVLPPFPPEILFPIFPSIHPSITLTPSTPYTPPPPS